jgi:hypothetical protein
MWVRAVFSATLRFVAAARRPVLPMISAKTRFDNVSPNVAAKRRIWVSMPTLGSTTKTATAGRSISKIDPVRPGPRAYDSTE